MGDGEDRDKQVVDAVSKCRNYVIVLSKNYGRDNNTKCEFDAMWTRFKTDATRQIILINIGYDIPADKNGRHFRAVQHIHKELTFLDRDTRMIERLKRRLGKPSACRPVSPNDIFDVAYSEKTKSSYSEANDDKHFHFRQSVGNGHIEAFDYSDKNTDSENTMVYSTGVEPQPHNTKRPNLKKKKSVFERLSEAKQASCDCQNRKGYIDNNAF